MHSVDIPAQESDAQRDTQLMVQVVAGQTDALQQLYHAYFRRGYALAWRILADSSAAEDCVHEVFLKLWQRPHLYNSQRGSFVHWFLTVVHHQAVNQVRRRGRTQPFASPQEEWSSAAETREVGDRPPGQSSVEEGLSRAEVQRAVRAGLARLNPHERLALELAYFGGLSQSEIAAQLNWPLGTVKTRIRTGMLRMRAALQAADLGVDAALVGSAEYRRG